MSNSSLARQRINSLLDDNSFVEIGASVTARATDFNLKPAEALTDGVVTGYGVIDGRPVYVYSQDASVLGGSVGEMHAKKIAHLYNLAMKTGAPVIGLLDSTGLRLQESTDALAAFGKIYRKMTQASGVIPQITAVFGGCGGGLAVLTGLSDFTFMEEKKGKLFVNSPNALAGNYTEKLDTAGAKFQSEESGLADFVCEEAEIYDQMRSLITLLPSNNEDEVLAECTDDLNRSVANLSAFGGDIALAIAQIADDNEFVEVKSAYAKNMVTGFIRLNGATVGVVGNRSEILDENGKAKEKFETLLKPDGCKKAISFISFCDAFEIPIVSFTNVTGYSACIECEKKIARAVAGLTFAFASATVPKVNVVVGKAFGSAAIAMNSGAIGADVTLAWENAEIGTMNAKDAAAILFDGEKADVINEKAAEYAALQNSAKSAAARGYVDQIIDADETRKYVIGALEMLYSKSVAVANKKHGTV
ncbi:MAG: carboxyl transferase [Lachnospiraceae bacterium]|nr:carboxyl transferase [Lachnospiraceae bacterium]